jgi:hypothetical protein
MRVIALSAPVLPLEFIAQSRTSIILHRQADTEGIGGPLAGRLAEAAGSVSALARIRTKYVKLTGNALCFLLQFQVSESKWPW